MWTRLALGFAPLALVALTGCSDSPTSPEAGESDVVLEASVVFEAPGESPGPPFWSISGNGGFVPHDGEWAAFPFVRELGCVPPAADLLAIVGPPAFGCTMTVAGHEHWQNGPGIDPAPRQTVYKGLGDVPIVFARWSEVQPAMAGGLTLPELLGLSSARVGYAARYNETDILGVSGPHGPGKGMYKIQARGELVGGGSFVFHLNEVLGELKQVRIDFGS